MRFLNDLKNRITKGDSATNSNTLKKGKQGEFTKPNDLTPNINVLNECVPIPVNPTYIPKIGNISRIVPTSNYVKKHEQEDEERFYMQAKYMIGFELYADEKQYKPMKFTNKPTYSKMSKKELHCYFAWRTKVRKGVVNKTSLANAYIYICELINLIGVNNINDAFNKIAAFWLSYRKHDVGIDEYAKSCLKDLYICYGFKESFSDLLKQANLENFYPDVFKDFFPKNFYSKLFQMSSYISDSKANDFIEKIFVQVMNNLKPILKNQDVSIENSCKKYTVKKILYKPFYNTIYFTKKYQKKICLY